jgi:hypothetical protein
MKAVYRTCLEWWLAWFIALGIMFGAMIVWEMCTFERSMPLW